MRDSSPVRFVEHFHLLFLAQLGRRLDKAEFVLKGGCNLRFFHQSLRYSEDMDLDLGEIGRESLRDRVRDVFASRPFGQILEAAGIRIDRVSEPTQTDTTQRWKVGLRVAGTAATLPTKIECSRRGLDEGVAFGSVGARVVRDYQLPPLMVSHYDAPAALRQKIGALAGRRELQARDVFDLHHLIGLGAPRSATTGLAPRLIDQACANAMDIDFGMFKSQVLAFLEPDIQPQFDSARVWDTMVLEVVEALRGGAP